MHEMQGSLGVVALQNHKLPEQGGPRNHMPPLEMASPLWSIHFKHPQISQWHLFSMFPFSARTTEQVSSNNWQPPPHLRVETQHRKELQTEEVKLSKEGQNAQKWQVKQIKTQQLTQRLFNWGTIIATHDKQKLEQKSIWHWTDTTKQITQISRPLFIIMPIIVFKTFCWLLFP